MADQADSYVKTALQSSTIRWVIAAGLTHIIKTFGIEMLPDAVHSEIIGGIVMLLDLAIPAMLAMAARGRMRAKAIIEGWWNARDPV